MSKKKRNRKNIQSSILFFALFILFAFLIVIALEYIDFKKGESSFIFTRVINLKTYSEKREQFNKEFLKMLEKNSISCNYFKDKRGKYHFKIDIKELKFDSLLFKTQIIVKQLNGNLQLSEIKALKNKSVLLFNLEFNRKISHIILVNKAKEHETKIKKEDNYPKIAFIIDDIGFRKNASIELKELNIPITGSILPNTPFAKEEAKLLNSYGLEEMIHLPMQAENSNIEHPRNVFVTINSTDREIKKLIKDAKKIIPFSKGLNNHMGSLITARRVIMKRVLKIVKKEGLFFIDSRTSPKTVAYDVAKELKIRTTYRDVFLDDIQTYSYSIDQIQKLIETAKNKGKAVAIGHPFETTFKAIKDSINDIYSNGIKIVFVSSLLE